MPHNRAVGATGGGTLFRSSYKYNGSLANEEVGCPSLECHHNTIYRKTRFLISYFGCHRNWPAVVAQAEQSTAFAEIDQTSCQDCVIQGFPDRGSHICSCQCSYICLSSLHADTSGKRSDILIFLHVRSDRAACPASETISCIAHRNKTNVVLIPTALHP